MKIPVGVVGASGFLGGELIRLLSQHAHAELTYAGAYQEAGRYLAEIHPNLHGRLSLLLEPPKPTELAARCRAVFLATPPKISAELAPRLVDAGAIVFDLSGAHRLRDLAAHERWYPRVERSEAAARVAVYGLPELNRERLRTADLVAMPGCFATAAALSLLPLRQDRGIDWRRLVIDGKTASTGAGSEARESGLHAVRSNVVSPYAPAGHRHAAEVAQSLEDAGVPGDSVKIGMSLYAIDAVRGLLTSAYVFTASPPGESDLRRQYRAAYRGAPFVRLRASGQAARPIPDPKFTLGSNFCDLGVHVEAETGRLVLLAALDNLMKGGAGQAVQAFNLRLGLPEDCGLEAVPLYPA